MARLTEIVAYLNLELRIHDFDDSSLNGLQVEGLEEVGVVASAVDAGESVIQSAVRAGAQLIVVHHGLFWGSPLPIVGPHKRTIAELFTGGASLYACHLPLDAHHRLGNNFLLAQRLELTDRLPAAKYGNQCIGCVGNNSLHLTLDQIVDRLALLDGATTRPQALRFGPETPQRICIVSGGGADAVNNFAAEGFDTLITGEPKQYVYHTAKMNRLNVVFAGHYATETVGVQAVGEELASKFNLRHVFIDEPTGI